MTCAANIRIKSFSLFLQLHHYIKQVNYINKFGDEIKFDDNGDPAAMYDLINWQLTPNGDMEFVTVGKFDKIAGKGRKNLHIEEEKIVWNSNKSQVGENAAAVTYNLEICPYVTVYCTLVSSFGQVPLSVCSSICPPGARKAIRPNFPICCHDCVVCAAGEISNQTGEERKRFKKVKFYHF